MSNTLTQDITLDDLNHFWSAEGLPVFYADRDDICDVVEAMGFSIYYLLAHHQKKVTPPANNNNKHTNNGKPSTTPPPAPTYINETQWFKVVNNFVGRSVTKCAPSLSDNFIAVEELAHYKMPLIPHVIVDKLDQFFRLVDAQHGTESIVMLTYDITKEGSEGWGILVPDQENTSAHCNYDPHSIAEMKPDDVMIVGSVHSHPHMAAYASGTDHADQADFDGIHITYGWQKSVNNGATQYHIELQMSGNAYTLKPEDVFENFIIQKEPDPDVVEWSSKVKKELPLPTRAGVYTPQDRSAPQTLLQAPITLGTGLPKSKDYQDLPWVKHLSNVYSTCEVPEGSILIAEVDAQTNKSQYCPSCDTFLDYYCIYDGFCDTCFIPISAKGTPRQEVMELANMYAKDVDISNDVPVYLVGYESDGPGSHLFVMAICETSLLSELPSSSKVTTVEEYEDIVDDVNDDYLLCCGLHKDDYASCFCEHQITYNDYLDYEALIQSEDQSIYLDKNVNCIGCEHYYSPVCSQMRTLLIDWIKDPKNHVQSIVAGTINKIDGRGCEQFEQYYSPLDESSFYYE